MTAYYDMALSSASQFFASRMRELCGQFDLPFFFIEPIWAADFLQKLRDREIGVRVLIDMAADLYEPDNPYLLIAQEVKKSGGQVIDDPDLGAVAAHKGKFHKLLVEHNIPLPETVIVPRSELETFRITDEIKAYVGEPFVVKPGWGGGGLGVNVDGHSEEDLRRSAELAVSSDSFLI
jgi:glutathione synthase/RimK-type ligase-like ATP-grasp enzyme